MPGIATAQKAAKRREVMLLWVKQLMTLHEKQGSHKAAAAGWLAAIFALRAAARTDGASGWGRVGDELIDDLEWGYRQALGAEAEKGIEVGQRLLDTHSTPAIELKTRSGRTTTVTASNVKALAAKAAEAARRAQAPARRLPKLGASAARRPLVRPALRRPTAKVTAAASSRRAAGKSKPVRKAGRKK